MPTANAFNSAQQVAARQRVLMEAQGYYAETCPRQTVNAGTAGVSGTVYYTGLGLLAGDVVTSLSCMVQTIGATLTLTRLGLYSKAGALVVQSAEVSASFLSTGLKTITMALTSNGTPYLVPADDLYYAAIVSVGTTPASLLRCGAGVAGPAGIGSGSTLGGTQAAQADLPGTATISTTSIVTHWFGVS